MAVLLRRAVQVDSKLGRGDAAASDLPDGVARAGVETLERGEKRLGGSPGVDVMSPLIAENASR